MSRGVLAVAVWLFATAHACGEDKSLVSKNEAGTGAAGSTGATGGLGFDAAGGAEAAVGGGAGSAGGPPAGGGNAGVGGAAADSASGSDAADASSGDVAVGGSSGFDAGQCSGDAAACPSPHPSALLTCISSRCGFTVETAQVQKWVASVAGTDLLAWADGTLSTWYHHIQPGSGITTNFAFQAPLNYPGAGQVSVWIDATGKSRLIFSVRESTTAHVQSGPLPVSWSSATHGCCDFGSRPLALDTANGFGYYQGYRLDLTTGAHLSTIALIPGNELFQAVVGGNTVYYATKNQLSKANWTSATIEWAKPIASSNAAVWAVADPSDGVVVASAAGPLGRVKSDGAFAWSVSGVKAAIPPVLGSNGLVYVGTADPELGAYRASDGVKQWSIPLPSVPMDLAVAGDHLVYVLLGGSGQLLGIDPSVHEAVFKWTGIPGQGKAMLLRGGTMFVLGTSSGLSKVVAIPVPSASLDSKSPWPVLFHDNQRSCDRNGSLAF